MSWPHYKEVVTVVDVFEGGACYDGVIEWLLEHDLIISGKTEDWSYIPQISNAAYNDEVIDAVDGDGEGHGFKYGIYFATGGNGMSDEPKLIHCSYGNCTHSGNGFGIGFGYGQCVTDGTGEGYGLTEYPGVS